MTESTQYPGTAPRQAFYELLRSGALKRGTQFYYWGSDRVIGDLFDQRSPEDIFRSVESRSHSDGAGFARLLDSGVVTNDATGFQIEPGESLPLVGHFAPWQSCHAVELVEAIRAASAELLAAGNWAQFVSGTTSRELWKPDAPLATENRRDSPSRAKALLERLQSVSYSGERDYGFSRFSSRVWRLPPPIDYEKLLLNRFYALFRNLLEVGYLPSYSGLASNDPGQPALSVSVVSTAVRGDLDSPERSNAETADAIPQPTAAIDGVISRQELATLSGARGRSPAFWARCLLAVLSVATFGFGLAAVALVAQGYLDLAGRQERLLQNRELLANAARKVWQSALSAKAAELCSRRMHASGHQRMIQGSRLCDAQWEAARKLLLEAAEKLEDRPPLPSAQATSGAGSVGAP
jgi:hypothetical protein